MFTVWAVKIFGKARLFYFLNELEWVIWMWPCWKAKIIRMVRAKIRIEKIAEHQLVTPDRKDMIFVLTSLEFFKL